MHEYLAKYRQIKPWASERGGQLFAVSEGNELRIVAATGPHRQDRASRNNLVFDLEMMTRDRFSQYELGHHFVGFWHTHPEPYPSPSRVDWKAVEPELEAHGRQRNGLLTIVVGNLRDRVNLWVGVLDHERKVTRLKDNNLIVQSTEITQFE